MNAKVICLLQIQSPHPQHHTMLTADSRGDIATERVRESPTPHFFNHTLNASAFDFYDNKARSKSKNPSQTRPAFDRWRPKFHLMAPHGWMNDPCALGYNEATGTYHAGFQWNPKGYEWGNMSWGCASSNDLLHWNVQKTPSMEPDRAHGEEGVFTGSMLPTNPNGEKDGSLTAFFTSARYLPLHYTLPYTLGTESIHMAKSTDGGRSWTRYEHNPIVSLPPKEHSVLGWRDPFITRWKEADFILGKTSPSLYGLVAGSIRGKTPTVFLYEINPIRLIEWAYIGTLSDLGMNFNPSAWTGDYGQNFETANLISLADSKGKRHNIMTLGVEGCLKPRPKERSEVIDDHSQMWLCGQLKPSSNGVDLGFKFGGIVDHGCYYAMASFPDPITGEQVAFGWVLEEDLSPDLTARQKWSGCLSIPRVLRLVELHSVTKALKTDVGKITSIQATPTENDTFSILTFCAVPDPRLQNLRSSQYSLQPRVFTSRAPDQVELLNGCDTWEMKMSLKVGSATRCGFEIDFSQDYRETARIYFEPGNEMLYVDRSASTSYPGINRLPERAPHTLFTFLDSCNNTEELETLDFHVYYDCSVLEIFVNGRTAITTRVYPTSNTSFGVRPFVESTYAEGERSELVSFNLWELDSAGCIS
ncbi:unnamed protein product [Clonostachys rosea f. rosea IK726]|uniref:Glycosyl hydrolase family 32 N-terminal domain-containing protein n=2 Tax=Bionectria ochroleuca TaxID=29856 RepID=A0A0B7KLY9_BIOOC|nr:unnamed protein product [Clonostachys rosea f. rosea IK726]